GLGLVAHLEAVATAEAMADQREPPEIAPGPFVLLQDPLVSSLRPSGVAGCLGASARGVELLAPTVHSLAQDSGAGVARVRAQRQTEFGALGIDRLELGPGEHRLAPDFDHAGDGVLVAAGQLVRDGIDELGVVGDVLADAAVAARGQRGQPSVPVDDVDREAVDLGLAQVPRTGADLALDPARPLGEIVVMERVVEAEQAFEVLDRRPRRLAAAGLGDRSTDLLRGRIGRSQRGVFGLDGLELMHQLVELGIADGRRGEVIPLPVLLDLLSQGSVALADVGRDVVDVGWQVSRLGRHKHRRYCLPPTMSLGDACSRPTNKARAIPPATAEPVMAVAVARPSLPRAPTTTATNAPKLNRIAPMTAAAVPALSPCLDSASASVF